jgi:hypothetical protein
VSPSVSSQLSLSSHHTTAARQTTDFEDYTIKSKRSPDAAMTKADEEYAQPNQARGHGMAQFVWQSRQRKKSHEESKNAQRTSEHEHGFAIEDNPGQAKEASRCHQNREDVSLTLAPEFPADRAIVNPAARHKSLTGTERLLEW